MIGLKIREEVLMVGLFFFNILFFLRKIIEVKLNTEFLD